VVVRFEWDIRKAKANLRKHGVSDDLVRVISARKAAPRDQLAYRKR